MHILIGADIVPTKSNIDLFEKGDATSLIGEELCSILASADYTMFNLETPLTDVEAPIKKKGPALRASSKSIEGIAKINPFFFTLANNHIMDQGNIGLHDTISLLDSRDIHYAGVGKDKNSASTPYIFSKDNNTIGVYCCAEEEFSGASNFTAGANVYELIRSNDEIRTLSKKCDYTIVLYHGGKEEYRYPAPYLRDICRMMIDSGADVVVCQHSHCIGCEEKWNNGHIIYGQGNFLFDAESNDCWNSSLLINLQIDDKLSISYIPIIKRENVIRLAKGAEADSIMEDFLKRTEEISQMGFVEEKYAELSIKQLKNYLLSFSGKTHKMFWFRVLNKISGYRLIDWYISKKYDEQSLLCILNYMRCETHRDLIMQGLKESVK